MLKEWRGVVLKEKYFESSRERLKGVLLSLMILAAVGILLYDIYGSIWNQYSIMVAIEAMVIIVLLGLYLLFPYYVSLGIVTNVVLAFILLLILLSMTIPGYNQEFVLFAIAIMPAYIFFFLGIEKGVKWSIAVVLGLLINTLNASVKWVEPVFTFDLLAQVSFAYIIISYFHYILEKERLGYEEQLAVMLRAKEVLLKEVHHRVKNNLQVIIGLLESQSFRVRSSECKKILSSQIGRLQTMSFVHESLTQTPTDEKVDVSKYLKNIAMYIQRFTHHKIEIDMESCVLGVSEAMNLGLFLNEALSNAIEHAYDQEVQGVIEVSLKFKDTHHELTVRDFGKGFDNTKSYESLGLILMEDISNFFPEGNMVMDFANGTEITISF